MINISTLIYNNWNSLIYFYTTNPPKNMCQIYNNDMTDFDWELLSRQAVMMDNALAHF